MGEGWDEDLGREEGKKKKQGKVRWWGEGEGSPGASGITPDADVAISENFTRLGLGTPYKSYKSWYSSSILLLIVSFLLLDHI